jgi:hypothetical protein
MLGYLATSCTTVAITIPPRRYLCLAVTGDARVATRLSGGGVVDQALWGVSKFESTSKDTSDEVFFGYQAWDSVYEGRVRLSRMALTL